MTPHTRTPARRLRLGAAAALIVCTMGVQAQAALDAPPPPSAAPAWSLRQVFDTAWARQPEAQALPLRRAAVDAQRRATQAWTPEPPAWEASHRSDRLTGNDGSRELEIGIAAPLWLPGERSSAAGLTDAQAAALESRAAAARLRLAAAVREAWWSWQRADVERDIARAQADSARRLADDVARRVLAGELARADQHQAEGAVAAAEAALAHAEAEAAVARQQVFALAGSVVAPPRAGPSAPEPDPAADDAPPHPVLTELEDRSTLAERAATVAALQSRANPELALSTTRDRGAAGERYGHAVTLALRIPFGGGPRHEGRVADARAEAAEAQAQLALERSRLQAEREAAQARVQAARSRLAAADRRASLARETRGFFEKSFRLGESDLPTRLRIDAEATEAERQAARSRIDLAAAVSAWRQALGLLPP